jgi:hypothetical protein
MAEEFRVVAIIAAYNEEDVIGQVVGDLIQQGVHVYLLDHGSTDNTVLRVEHHLGRGLLGVEPFPHEGPGIAGATAVFPWEDILRRKEVLAAELDADWFIHHDADELRESPWAHLSLRDAVRTVDRFGYNAIDFEPLYFWPTNDRFRSGDDLRQMFRHYAPAIPEAKVQIKCWKKTAQRVDLASSGGHDAMFPDRRVFPIRFVLRHYPVRSQAHGERKVFGERRPRFVAGEKTRGWHVQYDAVQPGESFLRDPGSLIPYDPEAVRLHLILRHRGVEALEREIQGLTETLTRERRSADEVEKVMECEIQALTETLTRERRSADEVQKALEREIREVGEAVSMAQREVVAFTQSRSWRVTAPLRALHRWLRRGLGSGHPL